MNHDSETLEIDTTTADYRKPVQEITAHRFHEMLNVLPPMDWHPLSMTESFKMCEFYSGDITSIFVRLGSELPRYFTLMESYKMPHAQLIAKALDFEYNMKMLPTPPDMSTVCTVDAGGRVNPAVQTWAQAWSSFKGVNGCEMVMVNAAAYAANQVEKVDLPRDFMVQLVGIDPAYLVVNARGYSMQPAFSRISHADVLTLVGDYETPEVVPEWQWIKANACMAHRDNDVPGGSYEFVVMCNVPASNANAPLALQATLKEAHDLGAAYVLFHQGC